ncbi:biotin carboxylase N-terminal domain-containing protein [Aeromicrobium sp. IC_218]|uniref:acetyl/propionyl/methylcrotonyl-CoA carboxylase subunit alpha n=1 Tax=Aeromicrobium sp. IC_218 TaxID=2545468 RepID=UPI00103F8EB0|nr:biotin carboxylase N-terminal domain-containing protein [Aeromicrobium sp. IC_218]TCI99326.1 biotin/lipoyl-binding protein [Aeromicrobium sp. IC_218]
MSTFTTVLVANRGEIARRVFRTCREQGLRTVAVYSDADADAPFVGEADVAVRLGPTPAAESYLSVERLLAAARESGADAVHPGYGFLSENAGFARAVVEAGLTWIGPAPDVIELMGRKDRAREVAERAGVPVTPRFEPDAVPADAYPVLVKAAAGGGGKGMHVVRTPDGLAEALARAAREASAAFGDDTLLVERYVEGGRHVEVQVFGDEHGDVVHLGTRDCSAQRRHQKVLEEAPAPDLPEALRQRLHDASVALAREVGYTGAGTVEFLVAGDEAFFLEMNTRLQVEHPVTEEVTGTDLVAWQLAVAAGEPLPLAQDEIGFDGHALEVRVYAEDPYAGFLPQAGTISALRWGGPAREESAYVAGGEVTTAYDPMIAKLVTHGTDRAEAIAAMLEAIDGSVVVGLTTNLGFLRRLVATDDFRRGPVPTDWLDAHVPPELLTRPTVPAAALRTAAHELVPPRDDTPFGARDGWRVGEHVPVTVTLEDDDGTLHRAPLIETCGAGGWLVEDDVPGRALVAVEGQVWTLSLPDGTRRHRSAHGAADADVTAPMPGTVLSVAVAEGQHVNAGESLGVLEAMKMELALTAPYDGVVTTVAAAAGARVALGDVLFVVEDE